mgnify:FL=1|tara:strand:+ start:12759 stop:13145 length:387 start_codon:yes stop_codon:yes gene_type:complete
MEGNNTSAAHQVARLEKLAAASKELPLVMLNINKYRPEVDFPGGESYTAYMESISYSVGEVGGSVLWRSPVRGSVVGDLEGFHEVLAVWYPSHKAFLELPNADGAREMFRYRRTCVEEAHILELPDIS